MFFVKFILSILIILINFNSILKAETLTFPTNLVANTTDFILLSSSGTTPSISGYSGTLLFSATATAGNIKVTDTSNLLQAAGYCGYTADASAEPTDCSGNSLSEVGFRGSQDDINTAIATLSFKGDGSTGSPSITVSITPAGTNYYSVNGHYYEVVRSNGIDWDDAKTAAEASTLYGLTGYLVTITSAGENSFVSSKVNVPAWMGASDNSAYTSNTHATSEGTWEWVSGPENGKTMTCQPAGQNKGAVAAHEDCEVHPDTTYENWSNNEPNDCCKSGTANQGEEDYLHIKGNGTWNDYDIDTTVNYYIIEYGGMPGETATTSNTINLIVESIEASGSTYNIFDDKELVGMVDAENESATRLARNSMDSVLDRIHEFRLRKKNKGFNENNISLQVNLNNLNKNYQAIINHYASKGLTSLANYSKKTKRTYANSNNWQHWFNGKISNGRTGLTANKLGKKNDMDTLTIGFDKLANNTLFGIAFNLADDETDIGNSGTNLRMRAENLMLYSAWNKESFYLDSVIGYGSLKSLTKRVVDLSNPSNLVKGVRDSEQFYATTYLNHIKNINNRDFQIFAGLDYIYTYFNGYSENGNDQKVRFKSYSLKNYTSSIGSILFYKIENKNSDLTSFYKIEYKQDHSEKALVQGSLISDTSNTIYSYNYNVPYNYFMKIEMGLNIKTHRDLNIYSKLGRIQKSNDDFQNSITIEFSQPF